MAPHSPGPGSVLPGFEEERPDAVFHAAVEIRLHVAIIEDRQPVPRIQNLLHLPLGYVCPAGLLLRRKFCVLASLGIAHPLLAERHAGIRRDGPDAGEAQAEENRHGPPGAGREVNQKVHLRIARLFAKVDRDDLAHGHPAERLAVHRGHLVIQPRGLRLGCCRRPRSDRWRGFPGGAGWSRSWRRGPFAAAQNQRIGERVGRNLAFVVERLGLLGKDAQGEQEKNRKGLSGHGRTPNSIAALQIVMRLSAPGRFGEESAGCRRNVI